MAMPGSDAGAATPTCGGRPATHIGTPGDDVLVGTNGDDVMVGRGGNDVLRGRQERSSAGSPTTTTTATSGLHPTGLNSS